MVIPSLAGIGRAAYGMGLATMLSACIILPRETAIPSIVPQLPGDLHNSDVEALVLTIYPNITRSLEHPIFMKEKDLASLTDIVKLESGTIAFFPHGPGVQTKMQTLGTTLCVILSDGRTFMFAGGHPEKGFAIYRQDTLSAGRRDAIVSALRDHGASAFDRVDGPCEISAKVNWPQDIASTVIEFLMRIPEQEKEPSPIARFLESKETRPGETRIETQRVMLLASVKWRNRTITEAPMYLSTTDAGAVIDVILASKMDNLLALFPSFGSGVRSVSSLVVERVCAISRDGRVVWWSVEDKMWKQLIENPPYPDWKANILGFVAGTRSSDWDLTFLECVPSEIRWTSEERLVAMAFLERLPSQERPPSPAEALIARSKTLLETPDSRGTDVMLLCSPWCIGDGGFYLTPAFLRVDNVPTLGERISSLRRDDFVLLLSRLVSADPRAPKFGGVLTVYVVGSDGVMIQLKNDELKVWGEPKRILVSSKWRSDAMDAVNQNFRNVRSDSDALFFTSITGWSRETQKRVVTFLETINIKDSEPAMR